MTLPAWQPGMAWQPGAPAWAPREINPFTGTLRTPGGATPYGTDVPAGQYWNARAGRAMSLVPGAPISYTPGRPGYGGPSGGGRAFGPGYKRPGISEMSPLMRRIMLMRGRGRNPRPGEPRGRYYGGPVGQMPRPFAEGGTVSTQRSPQQILYQMLQGLYPRRVANLLPTMRDVTSSIVSGLGKPPEDFWAQVQAGAPPTFGQGQIAYGNF